MLHNLMWHIPRKTDFCERQRVFPVLNYFNQVVALTLNFRNGKGKSNWELQETAKLKSWLKLYEYWKQKSTIEM